MVVAEVEIKPLINDALPSIKGVLYWLNTNLKIHFIKRYAHQDLLRSNQRIRD